MLPVEVLPRGASGKCFLEVLPVKVLPGYSSNPVRQKYAKLLSHICRSGTGSDPAPPKY